MTSCKLVSFTRRTLLHGVCKQAQQTGCGCYREITVQVKEAEMHKTKYNNGHIIYRKWNFQTQVDTKDILSCLYTPENAKCCWKITNKYTELSNTRTSNCWKAYNCLENEGLHDLTRTNSITLVDPENSKHAKIMKGYGVKVVYTQHNRNRKRHFHSQFCAFLL